LRAEERHRGGNEVIRVCYYKGCGAVYGEKEPLWDNRETHGLCPKHLQLTLREIKSQMGKLKDMSGGLKILIVEDSTLFRELFKERLHDRFQSVEIYEAAEGEEALRKIETLHPKLIFMDIRLPGENGLELTKKIKARYPNITVIILTSYDLPEYREFSYQCADYFFSKKSSTLELVLTLVQSILPIGA
jgi:CheY-like chemotaxis protein